MLSASQSEEKFRLLSFFVKDQRQESESDREEWVTNRMMKGGDEMDSFFLRWMHSPVCLSSDRMYFADFYIELF